MTTPLEAAARPMDEAAWAICPDLRFQLHGKHEACLRCPVASFYPGIDRRGQRACRMFAEKAVRAVLRAIREPPLGVMAAIERAMDNIPRTGVVPENTERAHEGWTAGIDSLLSEGE